jgi:hypothetical protein
MSHKMVSLERCKTSKLLHRRGSLLRKIASVGPMRDSTTCAAGSAKISYGPSASGVAPVGFALSMMLG